jgi:hypothetical protein
MRGEVRSGSIGAVAAGGYIGRPPSAGTRDRRTKAEASIRGRIPGARIFQESDVRAPPSTASDLRAYGGLRSQLLHRPTKGNRTNGTGITAGGSRRTAQKSYLTVRARRGHMQGTKWTSWHRTRTMKASRSLIEQIKDVVAACDFDLS